MNEIDKLKTEHARYKKALEDIKRGVYNTEPSAIANEALNPSPPVTLDALQKAAYNYSGHVQLYGDGSVVWKSFSGKTHFFSHAQDLLDFLNA